MDGADHPMEARGDLTGADAVALAAATPDGFLKPPEASIAPLKGHEGGSSSIQACTANIMPECSTLIK